MQLNEDERRTFISGGRRGKKEKDGKNRYEKRMRSHLASSVREFNQINMQSFFTDDILTVSVPVRGETDDYQVKIKIGGVLGLIQDGIEKNDGELSLNVILKALTTALNEEDIYCRCNCLHPDTRLKLMDGTSPTIAEMKERHDAGEPLYVHSVDDEENLKWGEVEDIWISRDATQFTKIILDNDQYVLTTPEHLYLRQDGEYVPARVLTVGDELVLGRSVKGIEDVYFDTPVPVYDLKIEEHPNFMVDAGVILHNCGDFRYRQAYWFTQKHRISDDPEDRPSDITNPDDDLGPGCKHIMLVLSNYRWVVKVANVIWNYTKYMRDHRQNDYARVIYPALYGKKYEEPVQLTMDDTGEENDIDSSEETIDTANETSRTSGQFKPGNPHRFQPKLKSNGEQVKLNGEEGEEEENNENQEISERRIRH